MVERQGLAGQLDPDARRHPPLGTEALQVRIVSREPVVFRARGELDLLAEQVQHPAELARGVIARGAGMAVKVAADPAVGLHGADQLCLQADFLALHHVDLREDGVVLRAVADDDVVGAGVQLAAEAAVVTVNQVLDRVLAAIRAEVGAPGFAPPDELHLAGDRPPLFVADPGDDRPGLGQLDRERSGGPGCDRHRLRAAAVGRDRQQAGRVTRVDPQRAFEVGAAPGIRLALVGEGDVSLGDGMSRRVFHHKANRVRGLAGQPVGDPLNVEEVCPGDQSPGQPVRLAGREPDGDLAIAVLIAEQELPGTGGEDLAAVGDHSIGLAEVSVVDPERPGGPVGASLEGPIGADRVPQLSLDRRGAMVGVSGGDLNVGPSLFEGVGNLDIRLLFSWSGDQPERDAARLDEHPIELGRLIRRRGLDLDPGEFQVAKLSPG